MTRSTVLSLREDAVYADRKGRPKKDRHWKALRVLEEKEEEFRVVIRICEGVCRKILSLREGDVDVDGI